MPNQSISRTDRITTLRTAAAHYRTEAARWRDRGEEEVAQRFAARAVAHEGLVAILERSVGSWS